MVYIHLHLLVFYGTSSANVPWIFWVKFSPFGRLTIKSTVSILKPRHENLKVKIDGTDSLGILQNKGHLGSR